MKLKIIQKALFIIFNIGFAAAIFLLFMWLNGMQAHADAQNKEYRIGETIPAGDVEIVVTKVSVTPETAPPEIADPYTAFGGFRTEENCKAILPFQEYVECSQRNSGRQQIIKNLYSYHRSRLTVDYMIKSQTTHTIDPSSVTIAFNTYAKRDIKEPISIIKGVDLTPYGESEPVVKNGGKEIERQTWVDLHPDTEPTAIVTFTYKDITRKVPLVIAEHIRQNP